MLSFQILDGKDLEGFLSSKTPRMITAGLCNCRYSISDHYPIAVYSLPLVCDCDMDTVMEGRRGA